jgi:hypothetical protein
MEVTTKIPLREKPVKTQKEKPKPKKRGHLKKVKQESQ